MSFHLGKPILVMLFVSIITGTFVVMRPGYQKKDLTMWLFSQSHYKSFEPLVPKFEKQNNLSVSLELLSFQAEQMRLRSLFMSDLRSPQIPDVAEVEIGQVGMFFRAPSRDVGFLPLNDILKETGWLDKILPQRLASFTKD